MNSSIPAMLMALAGTLLLVVTYLSLYFEERKRYVAFWLAGWSLYALRFVFEILATRWQYQGMFLMVSQLTFLWSAVFLLWGTRRFSKKRLGTGMLALFTGASLWTIAGTASDFSAPFVAVPVFLTSALANIMTATTLLRSEEAAGHAKVMTGLAFILWGVHKLDYPVVRLFPRILPFGYLLGAVFGLITAVGIIFVLLKKSRDELKSSEKRYRSIFENAVEGIFQSTPEGRFVSANPALARMIGYESPERLIESVRDLATQVYADPKDRERFQALILKQGFVENLETPIRTRDGGIIWISMNGRAVRDGDGGISLYEGTVEDITHRRHAEDELRKSRLHLVEAAELARIAHWEYDPESDRFTFNDAFYALYATSAEREGGYLMGLDEYMTQFVHPEDIDALRQEIAEDMARTDRGRLGEYEHGAVRRDGRVIHILSRCRAITDSEGLVVKLLGVNQDITERKTIEERLMVANFAIQSSISGIGLADLAGKVISVNDSWLRLWGYDREEEVLGRSMFEFAAGGEQAGGIRGLREAGGYIGEGVGVRKDGSLFDVYLAASVVHSPDGKPVCIMASFIDISERKQAEARLRESEERYRFLFDSLNDAIFVYDAVDGDRPGSFIEVNEAACALLGYSREELAAMTPTDIYAPDAPEPTLASRRQLQSEARTVWEDVAIDKEGRRIPVEVSRHLFDFRGKPTILSAVRNISRRKSAEDALQATAARLVRAAEVSRTGNWELDLSTGMISTSSGASRIYGIGGSEWPLAVVQESPLPEYRTMLDDALRALIEEGSSYDVEFKIRRADDGSTIDVHSVAEYDSESRTVFGVIQDITEKKKLEGLLRQAQKMEAIGTLAGGVAHDFNNLLTVITGFADLMQKSIKPGDPLRNYLDQIVISSNKAADLTQSLLAFSRKQRINLESRRVNEVVRESSKLLRRLLPEDIELCLDLSPSDPVVRLDLTQMDQVLMNLATNARDAMPVGGRLSIKTGVRAAGGESERLLGLGKAGTSYALVSVSDTGIGMDEKTKARVFDPFFTTKDVGKGTGLGLATVYGIVTQHEGFIAVSSKPNEGTNFDIFLPLVDAVDRSESSASTEIKGGTETILVVEDDKDVRRMMKLILEDFGYVAMEAANGEEGIRLYGQHAKEIDLLILDVVMPGKNGKEVFDAITSSGSKVKCVFVSGYAGDVVFGKGIRSETVDFLTKPVSVHALLSKVREVLDR